MKSAEEMREISKSTKGYETFLNAIEKDIERAALEGRYGCLIKCVHEECRKMIIKKLKELGYRLQLTQDLISIYWKDK